jgi:EmrB/QacA subfamily drug resistance transporter
MSPAELHAHHHARRWTILGVIAVAQLMVVLDATIVNIALPSAQKALHFTDANRQWIVTAYALAFGSLLLLGGKLGDLFGRKWTFVAGLLGFATASAIGGFAHSFGVLVTARALQGAFGAILAPSALGLLTTTFTEPGERAKAFGIFGAIAGAGGAIGLLLGGVLTQSLSWRWAMYVNLAFALPAAAGALALLRNPARTERPHLDLAGTALATGGLFSVVYGFSNADTHGWGATLTVVMLAASVVLLAAFVVRQRRAAHPLLPLRVVLDRSRGGSFLAIGIGGAGMFGVFLFLTYYLQGVLGMSPITTGLAFLPMMAVVIATSTTAQTKVVPRTGGRPLVIAGMLLAAAGLVYLAQLTPASTYAGGVLPALLVMGLGMGLIFAPSFSSATAGVPASDAGVASAMVNTSQQVGGSIGTALLSTVAATATTSFAAAHAHTPAALRAAAVHGFTTAFWWSAAIFLIGAAVAATVLRAGVAAPARMPEAEAAFAH